MFRCVEEGFFVFSPVFFRLFYPPQPEDVPLFRRGFRFCLYFHRA